MPMARPGETGGMGRNARPGGSHPSVELENALPGGGGPGTVSFVGSGGKTSLLSALALAMRRRGVTVLAATTTHVRIREFDGPPFVPVDLPEASAAGLAALRRSGKIPFLHDGRERDRLLGVAPDTLRSLAKGFNALLVEADGCRGLPLKRLRDHEPPLPPGGSVVLVVGADAVGKRLAGTCFNHEGAAAQGLATPEEPLDAAAIRRILYSPRGYLDAVADRPLFLAVNKADQNPGAEALARELYHPRLGGIFVTSVLGGRILSRRIDNRGRRVAAVILAAGDSSRFGAPKQLARFGRSTILRTVLSNVLKVRRLEKVVLVLGRRHDKVAASLGPMAGDGRLVIVVNEDSHLGMSTSLRAGLRFVRPCDAAAIFLGDQPLVDPRTVRRVLEAYLFRRCRLAYPVAGGRRGHPVIFGRELFAGLEALVGDVGARAVVDSNAGWEATVSVDPETQLDIDRRKDLKSLRNPGAMR